MRILVPLDGSSFAESAIEPAIDLLRRTTTANSLTLLRVISPGSAAPDLMGFAPPMPESVFQAAIEGGQEYLARIASRRPYHGVSIETVTQLASDTAGTISQSAQDVGADLIVMTSHARTGISHFVLGSIAEAVLRQSKVPTLVVHREGASFPSTDRDEPLTILVPLDGTPVAEAILDPAITLAAKVRGAIRLVRVLPPHSSATPSDRMLTSETQTYFNRLRPLIEARGVPFYETIAWGEVVPQIIAVSQAYQTDLIAMATHGRTALAQLREGSVTLDLLHHVSTPLLTVYPNPEVINAPLPLSVTQHAN